MNSFSFPHVGGNEGGMVTSPHEPRRACWRAPCGFFKPKEAITSTKTPENPQPVALQYCIVCVSTLFRSWVFSKPSHKSFWFHFSRHWLSLIYIYHLQLTMIDVHFLHNPPPSHPYVFPIGSLWIFIYIYLYSSHRVCFTVQWKS